jgi:hypothetical protein
MTYNQFQRYRRFVMDQVRAPGVNVLPISSAGTQHLTWYGGLGGSDWILGWSDEAGDITLIERRAKAKELARGLDAILMFEQRAGRKFHEELDIEFLLPE